ncbi:MAG TPA: DUF2798 domain-containing protein [Gammaproteobacteria bacterium]|nr:DUF2798 domain-containing protein [Gammaproteobacteria bacterium]
MIPRRFQFQTFSFLMSLLMSGVISLAMLSLELAAVMDVITQWPRAWGMSMLIAFPVSMVTVPITQKLVSIIVASE